MTYADDTGAQGAQQAGQPQKAASDPKALPQSKRIDLRRAIEQDPPPLDFVLPGLVRGTVGALVSPGGVGKSFLALELAVLVATGLDLSGFAGDQKFKTGKVLYLAAEDPEEALVRRVHAVGKHLDAPTRDQLYDNFRLECLMGQQVDILDPAWQEFLAERASEGVRLVIPDTLRRFHLCDENKADEMVRVLSQLEVVAQRNGLPAVITPHHATKSAALNHQGDVQQASRGSSVLVDNARWQGYLVGMSKDEAKECGIEESERGFYVRAGVSKQNYGAPFEPVWMRRAEGGVLVPHYPLKKSKKELRTNAAYDAADDRRQRRESKIATL